MTTQDLTYIGAVPHGPVEAIAGFNARYLLRRSDLLFNVRNRPFRVSVIEAIEPEDLVVASGILASLRLHDPATVDPYYLAGLLRSVYGQALVQPYIQTSTNTTTINLKALSQLQVPLPKWNMQQQLAQMFRQLDEVRRNTDAVVEQRAYYADAAIRLAVEA
ncbi:restriction endonuclease subunit S (plasmid) [Deinococcus psychrotolerans]|uniref:Restriction endonuclease subunit S n=1 Tax=Deinococcus psychrotolerans TaxID=2489213 RepID=A0A3G8YVP4_9DEIO|nr:restriction endonuclease subunit S [Deinococcus psychrotolerans]AZI45256.1 restriction endonuclease subunit S [Deinococcus psychrotolerans]